VVATFYGVTVLRITPWACVAMTYRAFTGSTSVASRMASTPMPIFRPEGSERFLELTSALGVVDVRSADCQCIFVVAGAATDDEHMDAIRILARIEWPERAIVVARKASIQVADRRAARWQDSRPNDSDFDSFGGIRSS